jgi:hypothetical protein
MNVKSQKDILPYRTVAALLEMVFGYPLSFSSDVLENANNQKKKPHGL